MIKKKAPADKSPATSTEARTGPQNSGPAQGDQGAAPKGSGPVERPGGLMNQHPPPGRRNQQQCSAVTWPARRRFARATPLLAASDDRAGCAPHLNAPRTSSAALPTVRTRPAPTTPRPPNPLSISAPALLQCVIRCRAPLRLIPRASWIGVGFCERAGVAGPSPGWCSCGSQRRGSGVECSGVA